MDKKENKLGGAEGGGAESKAEVAVDEAGAAIKAEVAVDEAGAAIQAEVAVDEAGAAIAIAADLPVEVTSDSSETKDSYIDLSWTGRSFASTFLYEDHLTNINLSHNDIKVIPKALLALKNIVKLDLSNNLIEYFNNAPAFANTIEDLSLAYNSLLAPPMWVWRDTPTNLRCLNISENENVFSTLKERKPVEYYHCWLNIFKIIMYNCRVQTCYDVLYTLAGVHELHLGGGDISKYRLNDLQEFPTESLCCIEARIINVNHCKIYKIASGIVCYSVVKYIDFGNNFIAELPDEFFELVDLEVLILTSNKLKGLPEKMVKFQNLKIMLLGGNKIEKLPDNLLNAMPNLKCVDLYNNRFNTMPEGIENLDEFDIAQNYLIEPENPEYIQMRTKLRANHRTEYDKKNGNKIKPVLAGDHVDSESEEESEVDNAGPKFKGVPAPVHVPKKNRGTGAPKEKAAKGKR